MEFIDNPNIQYEPNSEQNHVEKCPVCGTKFNKDEDSEVIKTINLFLEKNKTTNLATNVSYLRYTPNKGLDVATDCLRIDYQNQGANLNNIQLQLGGNKCRVSRNTQPNNITTIASIIIHGNQDGTDIAYNANRIRGALYESYKKREKPFLRAIIRKN